MNQISEDKFYAGWMYIDLSEYDFLKELGVFGPMIYEEFVDGDRSLKLIKNSKQGTVSHCYCSGKTLLKLEDHYHNWWANNYIHYSDGDTKYPSNHFSIVSSEWLEKRRWNEYNG